ncbi:MAG: DUF362 domain-containing protein [bacterium]|nr:DUF362 domain-containing protein [bacterium]
MPDSLSYRSARSLSRRKFLLSGLGALTAGATLSGLGCRGSRVATFIGRAASYSVDFGSLIGTGLGELGIGAAEIRGASVLLKPNMVETSVGSEHINTHPHVVRGAIEAFLRLGAERVVVGEGAGHRRDSFLVLEESGMEAVLAEDRVPFVDLNYSSTFTVPNGGKYSELATLTFPEILREVDWIVSMPKLKTHHWVGVTLSMKNMFGVMPGLFYGWPKNVLHQVGIENSILDINATLVPQLAIVDGVVGMEGDGPIMGTPRRVGAVVLGRNLAAVDATCARVMGVRPSRVQYLAAAEGRLGPIGRREIEQRGERIAELRTKFALLDSIPAQRKLK